MGNIRTAMNRGAFDFVVKPIDFKDLEVTIEKTLKHVLELKKNAQSSEENNFLRMFVSPYLVDRMHAKALFVPLTTGLATVAYIDIARGRSKITPENVEDLVRTLNANFEVIVPAVMGRRGVVEKFVGDAVLVIFQGEDHATRAVDACLTIRTQLRTLGLRAGKDSPFALGVSIGITTGTVATGEIGSKAYGRLDHSVLGDVPRAAATLEYAAKTNQILIDDATFDGVHGAFECNACDVKVAPFSFRTYEVVRRIGVDPSSKASVGSVDMSVSSSNDHVTTADTIITHDGDIPELIPAKALTTTADDPAVSAKTEPKNDSKT
jgi:class 3 adenylate cyclase